MAGRPLKPTALKVLQGNPGKRPLNNREPKPEIGAAVPEYLLKMPGPLAQWRRWAPKLTALGVLTEVDAPAFARLCRLWDLDETGATWSDEEEDARIAWKMRFDHQLVSEIRQLEGRFGLTPSDRGKIKVEPKKPESKLARFTRRRGARKA